MPRVPSALACVLLAIELAPTAHDLAGWWRDHQAVLRALPPPDLARAIAAKDSRKAAMSQRTVQQLRRPALTVPVAP